MARAIYIVLESRDSWWVDFEGQAFGPFTSKSTATSEAVSLARYMSHKGRDTEVRVPGDDNRYHVEWESAPDRYTRPPPRLVPRAEPEQSLQTA